MIFQKVSGDLSNQFSGDLCIFRCSVVELVYFSRHQRGLKSIPFKLTHFKHFQNPLNEKRSMLLGMGGMDGIENDGPIDDDHSDDVGYYRKRDFLETSFLGK